VNHLPIRLQYPGFQPFTDQSQECTVIDALFLHFKKPVMVHMIEEASYIRFATDARLDTGVWLILTRQGLSRCKMRRALRGAK
jgi:hypothetical protein